MEELQQDLCTPKEPEIPLLRSDSDSQEDHASKFLALPILLDNYLRNKINTNLNIKYH